MHKRAMLHRGVAVLLMTVQLSGCTVWQVESLSPAAVVERRPENIRVQFDDERRQVLYKPEIRGDSLVGSRSYESNRHDRAFALTGVTQVETHHVSANRTVGLVLGIGAIGFAAFMIGMSSMQGPFDNWGQ